MKEALLTFLPVVVAAIVTLSYFLRRLWKKGIAWIGVTMVLFGLWSAISAIPILRCRIMYHGDYGTVYSPSFRQSAFDAIQIGATVDTVKRSLGPPLNIYHDLTDSVAFWYAARGPRNHNYWIKAVVLDGRTWTVKEKVDDFYAP